MDAVIQHIISSPKFGDITERIGAKSKFDGEPRWRKHCRRFLYTKDQQAERFTAWYNKWSRRNERYRAKGKRLLFRDGTKWGQIGAAKQFVNSKKHIVNGCLEDPSSIAEMHINMGTGARTKLVTWREKRGTSHAEAGNRVLNLLTSEVGMMLPVYMSR